MSGAEINPTSNTDGRAPFGNLLLLLVLCLFTPETALWTVYGEPGTFLRGAFWTPVIPPAAAILDLAHVGRHDEWPGVVAGCLLSVALYWTARGIAQTSRRTRLVLTIGCGSLLAAYSMWAWWAVNQAIAD
jgi:hypothetical protein